MNKKLKKALYMFGFALPIVAIPIITVACGTQTSQVEPTPTPVPEQQQPNKEPENKEPEIKKIEEVKPNLDVLKDKVITKDTLSEGANDLLDKWEKNSKDFKIDLISGNSLYKKIVESKINVESDKKIELNDRIKYSDFNEVIEKLNFIDLFDITKLVKENLNVDKLNDIKLSEVFSYDMTKLVEVIKKKNGEEFANKNSKYEGDNEIKNKLISLIDKNESSSLAKIKNDLNKKELFTSDDFIKAIKKLKFNDLIDLEKLQEKLVFVKETK